MEITRRHVFPFFYRWDHEEHGLPLHFDYKHCNSGIGLHLLHAHTLRNAFTFSAHAPFREPLRHQALPSGNALRLERKFTDDIFSLLLRARHRNSSVLAAPLSLRPPRPLYDHFPGALPCFCCHRFLPASIRTNIIEKPSDGFCLRPNMYERGPATDFINCFR